MNSLARTLAERLTTKLDEMVEFETFKNGRTAGFLRRGASEQTEAVIREAIDKTIEEAIAVCDKHFKECRDRPNCHLFDADVIRSLKQSNSGMEVRK